MCETIRFGQRSISEIKSAVEKVIPTNTIKTRSSIWNQFLDFCKERNYEFVSTTTINDIATILEDWAFNMKRKNGEDYKETCVKSIWNTTAKMVQEKYFNDFNISFDPFSDIRFKKARDARNTKRRILQEDLTKQKVSAKALGIQDIYNMALLWDEETPDGLQKKNFHICAFELAWRGNEAAYCKIHYFKEEINIMGNFTGRIQYNPIFTKTTQGGSKSCASSKWLVGNKINTNFCPVRLFKKLLTKRPHQITTDRLFLTPNPNWHKGPWFKNIPLGINSLAKWTKISAEKTGLDTKRNKITNHSNRSSAVSALTKQGVSEQQLIKLTGHASSHSLKPYLQMDPKHHSDLINCMRNNEQLPSCSVPTSSINAIVESPNLAINVSNQNENANKNGIIYQNCTFNIVNNYK